MAILSKDTTKKMTIDLTVPLANGERGLSAVYSMWKTQIWGEWEEVNNCYMNLA